jgi:hypothetical protein
MIRQCFLAQTGIMFHRDMLRLVGMEPDNLYPQVKRRPQATTKASTSIASAPGTCKDSFRPKHRHSVFEEGFTNEEDEDFKDAHSKIYDMLQIKRAWWILEVFPHKLKFQRDDDDNWVQKLQCVDLSLTASALGF